jgi:hypothetical protein
MLALCLSQFISVDRPDENYLAPGCSMDKTLDTHFNRRETLPFTDVPRISPFAAKIFTQPARRGALA